MIKDTKMEFKVPIRVEQALDLILAIPAHRSSNDNHAKFGSMLLEEYFINLRDEYKDGENAYMYLTNLFSLVASSVRAFSVQRDIFQTRWNSLNKIKNSILERANRLDKYSPFNGAIGKIITLFISFGSSGFIVKTYSDLIQTMGKLAFWIPVMFVVVMFAFDFALEFYRFRLVSIAERTLPDNVVEVWVEDNIRQYRKILKSFLFNAIEIQNYYYPGEKVFENDINNMSKEQLDIYLEEIIDKHMIY